MSGVVGLDGPAEVRLQAMAVPAQPPGVLVIGGAAVLDRDDVVDLEGSVAAAVVVATDREPVLEPTPEPARDGALRPRRCHDLPVLVAHEQRDRSVLDQ